MLGHLVTVCLALLPFAQCIQIHKHMTREEVLKTFQTGHDNVPEYEVVRIYHTLDKRYASNNSPKMVKFNAFKMHLSFYLDPSDSSLAGELTPVYTVTEDLTAPGGLKYTYQPDALDNIGRVYRDVSKTSAIIAYEGEDGETLVQGNLLEDLSVVPLPHRLHDIVLRETRDLADILPDGVDGEADFRRSHHHVVFKRREPYMNGTQDCSRVRERERRMSGAIADHRSKRSIPTIIYPEVLVVVAFSLYDALGQNLKNAVRYVLSFWNGVDLRYRPLENPKIRLNIGGIIVSLTPRGTPYLENSKKGTMKLDADMALDAMSRYFYDKTRLPYVFYDFTVAMTHLDMCVMENGFCETSTCGYAAVGGACSINNFSKTTRAVALIEDNGGYSGIKTVVHEVAHLMGVRHDGPPNNIDCPDNEGYIMSPVQSFRENRFQWSDCSLKNFYAFLSGPESSCLRHAPFLDIPIPRILPGQLLTANEQCEKFFAGSKVCDIGPETCVALSCHVPGTMNCRIQSAAAEGTSCGAGMYCINSFCVDKQVTRVPYSPSKQKPEIRTYKSSKIVPLDLHTFRKAQQHINNWVSW